MQAPFVRSAPSRGLFAGIAWKQECVGRVAANGETGLVQLGDGAFLDKDDQPVFGRQLSVDWVSEHQVHTTALFVCNDGRSAVVTVPGTKAVGKVPAAMAEALDCEPYSWKDPMLDSTLVACALVGRCLSRWEALAGPLIPHVERFLAEEFDRRVLSLPLGRPVTGAEHRFLSASLERRQAVAAFPFILPTLVPGLGTKRADAVVEAIDRREELVPALARYLEVEANVVRSMASLPAWHPRKEGDRTVAAVSAPLYAAAYSLMPPERRPGKDRARKFVDLVKWVEAVVRETCDTAQIWPVAEAAAAIWQRMSKRPYALPKYDEVAWLDDLAREVRSVPGVANSPVEGTSCGRRRSYMPETWAVLHALTKYHPTDLAAEGREWNRRERAFVRHAVRDAFPQWEEIPESYPDSYAASNGWKARRIRTVGELTEHSALASNCLSSYLPRLLKRDAVVYSLESPEGETEGHFEIVDGEDNEFAQLGQVLRLRNRKATKAMRTAAEEALEQFGREQGRYFPPMRLPDEPGVREAVAKAERAIAEARSVAHRSYVAGVLEKAAARFGVGGEGGAP